MELQRRWVITDSDKITIQERTVLFLLFETAGLKIYHKTSALPDVNYPYICNIYHNNRHISYEICECSSNKKSDHVQYTYKEVVEALTEVIKTKI